MKTLELSTSDLLPFQVVVDRGTVLRKMREGVFDALVIPYNGRFLVRDGTHASCAAEMLKKPVVAHVCECDDEFRRVEVERGFEYPFDSIGALFDYYEVEFGVEARRMGIFSFRDLNDLYMYY